MVARLPATSFVTINNPEPVLLQLLVATAQCAQTICPQLPTSQGRGVGCFQQRNLAHTPSGSVGYAGSLPEQWRAFQTSGTAVPDKTDGRNPEHRVGWYFLHAWPVNTYTWGPQVMASVHYLPRHRRLSLHRDWMAKGENPRPGLHDAIRSMRSPYCVDGRARPSHEDAPRPDMRYTAGLHSTQHLHCLIGIATPPSSSGHSTSRPNSASMAPHPRVLSTM